MTVASGQAQRIRRAGFDVGQADRDVAHAVGHEGRLRNVRPEVQAQGDLPSAGGRVGQVLHVFGTEIVVAPVAEQLGDAFAFERERVEVVLRPDAQQGGGLQAVDQLFQTPDGLRIGDGRIVPCGCDAERVPDFRLAAALAVEQGVGGAGAEVPVIFEDLLGDLRAQLRLYLGDQHRLFGQPLVEPVFESFLLRRIEVVVGPQPRRAAGCGGRAVKRIVRCRPHSGSFTADSAAGVSTTPESGSMRIFFTPVYSTSSLPSRRVVEQEAASSTAQRGRTMFRMRCGLIFSVFWFWDARLEQVAQPQTVSCG